MALGMSVTAVTATTATFAFTNLAADGTIELQIGSDPTFEFQVAPIYPIARGAGYVAPGLNQRASLYARARSRRADGTTDGWSTPTVGFRTADGADRDLTRAAVVVAPSIVVKPQPVLQVLATTAVQDGYPMRNLLRDNPSSARPVNGLNTNFDVIFQTAGGPLDVVALLNTNLPETATWQLFGDATQAAVTGNGAHAFASAQQPFRASANLPHRNAYHGLMVLDAPQALPWWRIAVTNAPTPGNTFYLEHLAVGLNRVTKGFSVDSSESPVDLGALERTRAGILDRQRGYKIRHAEFDISLLDETLYETVLGQILMDVNETFLVVPNAKRNAFFHDRILYGRMAISKISRPTSLRVTRSFGIDSII